MSEHELPTALRYGVLLLERVYPTCLYAKGHPQGYNSRAEHAAVCIYDAGPGSVRTTEGMPGVYWVKSDRSMGRKGRALEGHWVRLPTAQRNGKHWELDGAVCDCEDQRFRGVYTGSPCWHIMAALLVSALFDLGVMTQDHVEAERLDPLPAGAGGYSPAQEAVETLETISQDLWGNPGGIG